ncbi:antitoxin Xre/MbcA/ParS toxin-binding domain-containing protein [Mycolicibacter icosiumassiliensis]|uniref:antitoxin Xre/MbcA/ParS toxin-binding domain-containing protein n=1 Tax=Mycolicibacter icosiumassiliensis TaxID=1792835 RepID=UPI00098FFECA|nr:antitoxin Xre/MbcA/ParS toxin-binding domain-containing protein [Mycolicibacter icosiumassiliensis]
MTSPIAKLLEAELAAHGVDVATLGEAQYAPAVRSFASRLSTEVTVEQAWSDHLGALADHRQVLALTGWTKQALHEAVKAHRVLRLQDDDKHFAYLMAGFDDKHPARPLPGLKEALKPWAEADPRGWVAASWLMSPQPELDGRTPRDALADEAMRADVAALAEQSVARLAA